MASGDVKLAYGTEVALTISPASLASSATWVAGRESTAVVNTSNLFVDALLAGKITTGTTPTVGEIRVYAYGQVEDTPTYPGAITGSDAAATLVANTRDVALRLAAVMTNTTASDTAYWFGPMSVAALFGGILPPRWGVWVVHSTVAILNATAGNHAIWYQPVYYTVAP